MSEYKVIAGNIGCIYTGTSKQDAETIYASYVDASKNNYGRVAGESVYLMQDGEPIAEHQGSQDDDIK